MPSPEDPLAANAAIYEALHARLAARGLGAGALFLNWGLGGPVLEARRDPPPHVPQRAQWRLVLEALGPIDADGCDVLDISCGRGGTLVLLARLFACRSLSGIDIAPANVAVCRSLPALAAARIQQGDACRLPYRDGAFDLVLNIESSCAYPDQAGFLRQVHRVLRPGRQFVWVDLVPKAALPALRANLVATGFVVQAERDITAAVLAAREDAAAAEHAAMVGPGMAAEVAAFLGAFHAAPGSALHRAMTDGALAYMVFRLVRDAPGAAPAPPMPDRGAMIAALVSGGVEEEPDA